MDNDIKKPNNFDDTDNVDDNKNYNNGPSSMGNNPTFDISSNNADLTPFSAGTGVDMTNLGIGMGTNSFSGSMGIPLGLGMALGMHTDANSYWNSLGKPQKTKIINYIQGASTGRESKQRISKSIMGLSQQDIGFLD